MRFKDKIVLVTGAAGSIGSAAVRRFAEEGATVAIADLDEDRAKALAATFDDNAEAFAVDVHAREIKCMAKGDSVCEFIMGVQERLDEHELRIRSAT